MNAHVKPDEGQEIVQTVPNPEIRLNDDGTLDEVVAQGAFFHLEQQSNTGWWLCVEVGGRRVDVWLSSKAKIVAHCDETLAATR
jgi:hypothetical protein